MKIAVLGTGMVGRTLAAKLDEVGHDVVIGTRDPQAILARTDTDALGTLPYSQWQTEHPAIRLSAYPDAGAFAEVVLNATHGAVSLQALEAVGAANLSGKVIVDVALPLDMSEGMPPTLTVANTDSLGEQIQRAYPDAHVVKTLNTVFCEVMVDPSKIPGDHNIFLASDHEDAKAVALDILHQFGWSDDVIIDLGGIKRARSSEMYMPLYFTLAGLEGTFEVNISVKRAVASE